jgi:transcriptional regulator with XRE-family HTH domain
MKRRNDNSALAEIFNDPGEMAEIEQGASLLLGGIQFGEIRKRLGLSQAAVAERMGVSQRRISAIENGKPGSAQVSTLAAYAEALNGHLDVSIDVGDQHLVLASHGASERDKSDAIEHREEARWARARRKLLHPGVGVPPARGKWRTGP